ncbi:MULTISPECIES: ParA family protein [Burkholderia cepacia complex]|uniref:ParA family protein n=1 Tax=Burkholderia cepacia complex TaxID=87882 RepID=UPI00076C9252|nr:MULTISPECIES: ParA family protein [Burkholderia cepacia complex]KWA10383.1 chromosome partitioning protein [Burkholderia territorii]RQS99647.1 ParA family protein [Burkholderia seminalis]
MTKIVSLYNNKGGVAKTTTIFNLAAFLSKERSKKVLLVDCDPQCNCTELFFCSGDNFDDPDVQLPGTTIYEALKPRFDGDTARIDAKRVELAQSEIYEKLFLLRGDINFSRAEQNFSVAIAQAVTEAVHEKNTYAVLTRLFRDLASLHSFDYVLCDVGPSAGSITRMVILACDGVFIPTTPDRFSFQAVQGMGSIISDWLNRHEAVVASFEPFGLEAFFPKTKFYGAILNNYKIHRAGKKKASYQKWEERVRDALCTMLGNSALKRLEPVVPRLLSDPFVASIRDVGPMAPVAQLVGKAIFDINQKDTELASSDGDYYRGAVWGEWQKRMDEYRGEIEKLADIMS